MIDILFIKLGQRNMHIVFFFGIKLWNLLSLSSNLQFLATHRPVGSPVLNIVVYEASALSFSVLIRTLPLMKFIYRYNIEVTAYLAPPQLSFRQKLPFYEY